MSDELRAEFLRCYRCSDRGWFFANGEEYTCGRCPAGEAYAAGPADEKNPLPDEAGKNQEVTTPTTPEASGRGTGAGPSSPVEWPERQPISPGAPPPIVSNPDGSVDCECCASGSCEVCKR